MTGATDAATAAPVSTFEDDIRSLMPALLAYFVRRVRPQEDAADCLSDTLVVLWRRRADLPANPDAQRAWTFGIARGVLANQRRGRVRQTQLADRLRSEIAVQPAQAVDSTDTESALDALPERDRELVTLIVWDGFGVAEAGELLGLKPDAARARYSRARKRLRETLAAG